MIPLSTAKFDPKWFSRSEPEKDKNGVYLGLRANPFVPGPTCENTCLGSPCVYDPDSCTFLRRYRWQLDALDFNNIMARFERLGNYIKEIEGFEEEPILILMVYEPPSKRCSERKVIHEWFAAQGYPIVEWQPNLLF